jgi:pSer/pThr/pTyr-binding forkhead associated (FHA) protein
MDVKLVVMGGSRAGQEVPVPHAKFLIGRAEDCHLRPASDLVSRHHAVILVEDGFVAVRDFASKNGTFVNGQRIKKEQQLKSGDRLKIASLEFEVRLDVPVAGKKKPKVHSIQEAAARTVETVQADDEIDIGDLIGDVEDSNVTRTAEIISQDAVATSPGNIGDTAADAPTPTQEDPKGAKKNDAEKEKGRLPGFAERLKKMKEQAAMDTGSAADDVLRRFLSRKS